MQAAAAALQMQEEQMWRWQRVRRVRHRACGAAARVAVLWLLRWAAVQRQLRLLLRPPLVAARSQQQQQPSRQPQPPSA
jgi:hypothetical protein